MTLQRRLTILAGTAVALAVAAASIGLYVSVRGVLRDEIDRSLQERLEALEVDRLMPPALAIRHQIAPPTVNLDHPDPACDLDYAANVKRPMKIDCALSNSFGFGGTNGTLLMKKYE